MEFRILGPLEVVENAQVLPLGSRKQRALLALLVLHAGEVVSRDRLIDDLWHGDPPPAAESTLRSHVSRLRSALGASRLLSRPPGYMLVLEPEELDATRCERLVAEARDALAQGRVAEASERLRSALDLWRGSALADVAYEPFAQGAIAQLEELRLTVLEHRIEADLALGRHADLVGELEALIAEQPLRERLRGQLMLALYRSGRQAEALEAYQDARQALTEELGLKPGKELRELERAILQQDPSVDLVAPTTDRPEAGDAAAGIFVGRDAELTQLRAALEDAVAGHGRVVLIAGEPGIGKTRLCDEMIGHARTRRTRILVGRCWEAGGAPAYWPWVQALRAYIREVEPQALRTQLGAGAVELAQILPELREILPGLPEPASLELEGAGARFRLFDATVEFLRNACESRPILLILDDLHAADAPSLLLLQFLARELSSTRMLLIGAYRDVDPIPAKPLTEILAEVAREPVARRLSLVGLGEQDVAEYVELTASEIATPELVPALYEETEGNPLFVGEIVRLLSAESVRSESSAEVRLAIPQSLRDVIARRLTHLSEECNRLMVLASVIGREFAFDALAHMGHVSEDELLDTLDEAMTARLISDVPGGPGRLRFAHVLIRDSLYESLTTARRVRLHRLAVEALEALYGEEPGPHLSELAHHAIAGSEFDKGLQYARLAGDRELALLAYEEAARLYDTALEALDLSHPSDERARCELQLALGEAEARAGNSSAAKTAFLYAATIARRLGLPRELARAAAGYGGRIVSRRAGADDRLVPLLEEGLAALAEEDVELRARLLARLAGALRDEHSRDRRDRVSREAVELARRTGDPAALAYALAGRAAATFAPDTAAERLALGSELRDVAERIGDRERLLQGHYYRFSAQLQLGDVREAEADLDTMGRIADELRQPAQLWAVLAGRAMLALAAGRLSEVEELIPEALALGERAQPEMAIPSYWLQRYTLCDFRACLEEVEPAIRDLVTDYPARPVLRCALAHLYAKLGRLPEAQRAFDELARGDFLVLPFDVEWLYGMTLLAETCVHLRDRSSAPVLYGVLLPYAAYNAVDAPEGIRGSVSRYLGLLSATTKRWEEAEPHFEDALAMNADMGARPWLAHTQGDYARMLLARDGSGDRERANELLDQALTTYRELGMESYAAKAWAMAHEVGGTA